MNAKQRAAEAALIHIASGMTIGLGTGSTAKIFIDLLGAEIAAGRIKDIRGVPTSNRSDEQARALGIKIVSLAEAGQCDCTIDGADEIDPNLDLIKGLGGAMLREKVVAQNSKRLIIIADESKIVPHLGAKTGVPVEVAQFEHEATERYLRKLGATPVLRQAENGKPYITDNGNFVYDCRFGRIDSAEQLDRDLRSRAGVVETGLFIGLASLVIVATEQNVRQLVRQNAD